MDFYHIGISSDGDVFTAYMYLHSTKKAVRFTSHFFERYRERVVKSRIMTSSMIDCYNDLGLIGLFAARNKDITWIETETVFAEKVHIFAPINDGVVLLQWDSDKKVLQANTFVTEDMLSKKQLEMVGWARAYPNLSEEQKAIQPAPDFTTED